MAILDSKASLRALIQKVGILSDGKICTLFLNEGKLYLLGSENEVFFTLTTSGDYSYEHVGFYVLRNIEKAMLYLVTDNLELSEPMVDLSITVKYKEVN